MQRVSKEKRGKKKISREGSGIYSYITKSIARKVKEKSSIRLIIENTVTLQERHPWWGMPISVRILYKGGDCVILSIWRVWKTRMIYREEQEARGDFQKAVRKTKVVWISKEREKKSSIPHRRKSAAE